LACEFRVHDQQSSVIYLVQFSVEIDDNWQAFDQQSWLTQQTSPTWEQWDLAWPQPSLIYV